MITASEPLEFIPRGRQAVQAHYESQTDQNPPASLQSDTYLTNRLQNVVISDIDNKSGVITENWSIRECDSYSNKCQNKDLRDLSNHVECSWEEELYFKGTTAVWSKGVLSSISTCNDSESRNVIACYTCDSPIRHALFCTFYSSITEKSIKNNVLDIQMDKNETELYNPIGKAIPSICVIDSLNIRVFSEKGEDFITSLQFQVLNTWVTKFGILLEKEQMPDLASMSFSKLHRDISQGDGMQDGSGFSESVKLPTLFSLTHPLDEMCPLIIKQSHGSYCYFNDNSMKIIYTSVNPSIVLVFDCKSSQHSVYRLRKAQMSEYHNLCNNYQNSTIWENKSQICQSTNSNSQINDSIRMHMGLLQGRHSFIGGTAVAGSSPYSSKGSFASPLNSPYITPTGTPNHLGNSPSPFSSVSRNGGNSFARLGLRAPSPLSQCVTGGVSSYSVTSSGLLRDDVTRCSSSRMTEQPAPAQPRPLYPELCLEHVWTEQCMNTPRQSLPPNNEQATKCFLHTDLVGLTYLCYLQPTKMILNITRILNVNDPVKLIFGTTKTVTAKDAVALPKMKMMLVLDTSNCLILYTGANNVGKIHISGVLSSGLTPGNSQILGASFTSGSPFPRRSSLLPTSTVQPEKHFEACHSLSPVAPVKNTRSGVRQTRSNNQMLIRGLRESVGHQVTLEYPSEKYYRVGLPPISNCSFIKKCLTVLRQVLQRDLAMLVMIKWYGVRNAPGSQNISITEEWDLFQDFLLKLLGYDTSNLLLTKNIHKTLDIKPEAKKPKKSHEPSNSDWESLISSKRHQEMASTMQNIFNMKNFPMIQNAEKTKATAKINTDASLFSNIPVILFSIHLLYEELKLNSVYHSYLKILAQFLHQLSFDLRLSKYVEHYWKDHPEFCDFPKDFDESQISETDLAKLTYPTYMKNEPVDIFKYLYNILNSNSVSPYPYMNKVNPTSKIIVQLSNLLVYKPTNLSDLNQCINKIPAQGAVTGESKGSDTLANNLDNNIIGTTVGENAVLFLTAMGFTRKHISELPPAVAMLCHWAIEECRENPPTNWKHDAYSLLLRQDLTTDFVKRESEIHCETSLSPQRSLSLDVNNVLATNVEPSETEDGMENIETQLLRLRFPKDLRICEIRRLLHSATPVTIDITQSPDVSDHEFIEEQEKQLYSITTRTMALPVGRGMFTLRSTFACTTEPLPIPKLCLTGKAPPRGITVELTHIEVPAQMNLWPLFHNGAAAGLRLHSNSAAAIDSIDSTWIIYNRPRGSTPDPPTEHAGFLMALGLNGHLKTLSYMSVYEYLVKCNEMTSVGLLLGISATHRGTMDLSTTKLLSIHLEALLPPTSIELDIPQTVQVAALLGVGLVYQGTGDRHMAEVLLSEIGRPPGPEMENSVEREAYSLAAGLGLGLVTLGHGGTLSTLTDLSIPDTLHYYMVGGNKRPLTGSQKDKYKLPSFQIREGDCVNIDVTAPGATLALGLMFFGTSNQTIADWMKPAETHYMLDFVRPDLLLLRTISRGLILWHEICPTENWIEEQVPVVFRKYCLCTPNPDNQVDVDYEGLNQAYCNILAGACFCIGLKYAGSANKQVYELLLKYTQRFMHLGGRVIAELAGKSTIETCMNLILISLAMVMAGSGDLMTLRICRLLRARVGVAGTATATYGSHLATHMAVGLLLLGAGRYTLSTSPESIAALVCAFFPKFPTHSNDNRYHLQAFRHLYVLAVEPRLLIPRDIDSGLLCYSNITIFYKDSDLIEKMKAPCFLPELHKLKKVQIEDDRYWPVVFELDRNWEHLIKLLKDCYCLDIKQRAGCLSYEEDPEGFKTLLAQTLTTGVSNVWSAHSDNIFSFSNEPAILNFTQQFLSHTKENSNIDELALIEKISMQTYECVTRDMLHILPQRLTLTASFQNFEKRPSVFTVWQMKLLTSLVEVCTMQNSKTKLISNETALSMLQYLSSLFDSWEAEISKLVLQYTNSVLPSNVPANLVHKLVSYITFYEIISNLELSSDKNPIKMIKNAHEKNVNPNMILRIIMSTTSDS